MCNVIVVHNKTSPTAPSIGAIVGVVRWLTASWLGTNRFMRIRESTPTNEGIGSVDDARAS
jgi:hypothetical protein